MHVEIISILLTFFIFVIVTQVGANEVKSLKYAANRETMIKMGGNTGSLQKKIEPAKEPARSTKKLKAGLQSGMLFDYGGTPESTKFSANFLEALAEVKKFPLRDSLYKVIHSYPLFQNNWREWSLTSGEIGGAKSSNSGSGQSISNPYPIGDYYFGKGTTPSTFKLLQSKRDEPFKEIFMGFRLSLDPKRAHMLVEMNISPSSEKGPGVIIPF
jgi:hypothetical protein